MLIDCDRCTMRGVGCGDCVVSLLLGAPEDSRDVDEIEAAAFGALAAGGLAPPLRLVPVSRTNRPDVSWWPSGPVAVDLPTPDDLGPDLDLDLGVDGVGAVNVVEVAARSRARSLPRAGPGGRSAARARSVGRPAASGQ